MKVIAGVKGIEHHANTIWAILAVAVFLLPITIGAFFGAMDGQNFAVLFTLLGLLVVSAMTEQLAKFGGR